MMDNTGKISIVGDGGHAAVIRDLIDACIMLDRDSFKKIFANCGTIIAVGDNRNRKDEVRARKNYVFATLVHPSATLAQAVDIGEGTVIMAGAIVQARAKIGEHCIVNSNAVVEHDCVIDDFVHIAPSVTLCGGVHVGTGTLIGAGSTVIPSVHIGSNVTVGAGSTVINDIPDGVTVVGTPAKSTKSNEVQQ